MIKTAALALSILLAMPLSAQPPVPQESLLEAVDGEPAQAPEIPGRKAIDIGLLFGVPVFVEPACVLEDGELEHCELPEIFPVRSHGGEPPPEQAS